MGYSTFPPNKYSNGFVRMSILNSDRIKASNNFMVAADVTYAFSLHIEDLTKKRLDQVLIY